MSLNEQELLDVYQFLMGAYPEDLHIARPLIQMLEAQGKRVEARDLAMAMARRMLSLGRSAHAYSLLSLCELLGHPDSEELESMKTIAELIECPSVHGEGKDFELIEELSDSEALAFIKQGSLRKVKKGQYIVKQGEISSNFYIILDGELHVYMKANAGQKIELKFLLKGEFFGEFACIYHLPRTATVTTSADAILLEFSEEAIAELIEHSPFAGSSLLKTVQSRMIESVSLAHQAFREIEIIDRIWMARESEIKEYLPASTLTTEVSTDKDFFYIIVFGRAVAHRDADDGRSLQCELGVNAMFSSGEHLLGFPEGTVIEIPERCLVCKVPVEIFQSFSNAYRGFEHWVEQHVEARNKELQN